MQRTRSHGDCAVSMAQVFPIQSVEDLPEHLRLYATAADQGGGYNFPEPVTPCIVEFDPEMSPEMGKAAAFAAQMHDAALLMSYFTVSIWGECVTFEQQGMAAREAEQLLAVETDRAFAAYTEAMQALYEHHGYAIVSAERQARARVV